MRALIIRPRLILCLVLALSFLSASAPASVQTAAPIPAKKAMTVDDYSKWKTISAQALSADGKWLVYVLELTNVVPAETKPVMHIVNLETNTDVTVNDATAPVFSPDSQWLAYQVDPGMAQRARQGRGGTPGPGNAPSGNSPSAQPSPGQTEPAPGQPGQQGQHGGGAPPIPPRRVDLRNLVTGAIRSWENIGTFAFAPTSSYIVLRRRGGEAAAPAFQRGGGMPPQAAAAPGSTPDSTGPRGQDAVPPFARSWIAARSRSSLRLMKTYTPIAPTAAMAAPIASRPSNPPLVLASNTVRLW